MLQLTAIAILGIFVTFVIIGLLNTLYEWKQGNAVDCWFHIHGVSFNFTPTQPSLNSMTWDITCWSYAQYHKKYLTE